MPTIQVEAHVSGAELLRAAGQLEPAELERFTAGVLRLRAERQAAHLSADETRLLLLINQGLPEDVRLRYEELIAKRDAESLTPAEQSELLRLTDLAEQAEAQRIAALIDLAHLRKTALVDLMAQMGIPAPTHGA